MSNQVQFQSFNFNSNAVRVITDPTGDFWFCGADVCDILGYENSRNTIQKHCKIGGVSKRYTPTKSGDQEMIFINEPNLYRLIIKSRKPEAEPFEAWVFEEVLPQIRKTGQYQLEQKQLALPEPEKTYTRTFTEKELHILSVVMNKYVPMVTEFCNNVETQQRNVYTALGLNPKQNNPLAARAYSINHEFRYWTDEAKEIIQRIKPPKNYALGNF